MSWDRDYCLAFAIRNRMYRFEHWLLWDNGTLRSQNDALVQAIQPGYWRWTCTDQTAWFPAKLMKLKRRHNLKKVAHCNFEILHLQVYRLAPALQLSGLTDFPMASLQAPLVLAGLAFGPLPQMFWYLLQFCLQV